MRISVERKDEDVGRLLYGFRRGIGFIPSEIDVDQSLAMMLEFDDPADQPEHLEDRDLDADETWPSRRPRNR